MTRDWEIRAVYKVRIQVGRWRWKTETYYDNQGYTADEIAGWYAENYPRARRIEVTEV